MWRGRFAPSPSGRLHFGSLVAALASYLEARSRNGEWLLRIEDLDPPREQPGAADDILTTLEHFHLHWDGSVLYQSQRHQRYKEILQQLAAQQQIYACDCTRKRIKEAGGLYPGWCRSRHLALDSANTSIRLKIDEPMTSFKDRIQGEVSISAPIAAEDFIIQRKDGLFAYQLAVVVDDIDCQINHVVRGADLLDSTPRQLQLYHLLDANQPDYFHVPLASNVDGSKFSKQNFATAIDPEQASSQLTNALIFLNHPPPTELRNASCEQLLTWAQTNWNHQNVTASYSQTVDSSGKRLPNKQ